MTDTIQVDSEPTPMKGTIKTVQRERGFGFIRGEDGREFFFHHSCVIGARFAELDEGDAVKFAIDASSVSPKGPRAHNVERDTAVLN